MAATTAKASQTVAGYAKVAVAAIVVVLLLTGFYTEHVPTMPSYIAKVRPLSPAIRANEGITRPTAGLPSPRRPKQTDGPVKPRKSMARKAPQCSPIQLLPNNSVPLVALNSLPGSGNTWTRYLLEQSTRIYTGSVYNDKRLQEGGFVGEFEDKRCRCTVAVKIHWLRKKRHILPWDGGIFILRNPYDAILADRNRKLGAGHTGIAESPKAFRGRGWNAFALQMIESWETFVTDALSLFDKILVVYYEDLKSDTATQLRRMVAFLGGFSKTFTEHADIRCALQEKKGNFKRPKHTMEFDPFTPNLRRRIDGTIRRVLEKLRRANFTLPPYASSYQSNSTKV